METFRTHEYGIPLVGGGHLEGPHVFGFLICPLVRFDPKREGHPFKVKGMTEILS